MIHVYTGTGKGKTTAALGLAMRAVGHGRRVLVIQFMKNRMCGENVAAERLAPYLEIERMGPAVTNEIYTESTCTQWVEPGKPSREDCNAAEKALLRAEDAIRYAEYDMIILDEILSAAGCGLIDKEGILHVMRTVSDDTELVLTGHPTPAKVRDEADLVTEMRSEKHYFNDGVDGRKGIEF